MEFLLKCKDNAYPCEVIIDEDNGRYMIRKADSSGEVFNFPKELVDWVMANWSAEDFINEADFLTMLKEIQIFSAFKH